ncbi:MULTISPECIES: hypothetical protein [Microbacterium]|jgi:hypothetical protein|uniref:Uncharacterized protein n=1 Tax=Microbacterium schleiferi TaxID=69362 RepID=A0A7S8MWM0_9MICO|nr:hypothetical protein [Microbacterium schleiferi]QPE04554.1 hypothetical protein IT882_15775 [Microbacterium schleiferi]
MTTERGWAETPGGALLGSLIADAFARASQHDDEPAHSPDAPSPSNVRDHH